MNNPRASAFLCGYLESLMILGIFAGFVQAQVKTEAPAPAKERRSENDLQVIKLKYAAAADVEASLLRFFGEDLRRDYRVVADPRTNSLLVLARHEDVAFIKRVVETLDTKAERPLNQAGQSPAEAGRNFKVFPLGGLKVAPGEFFEKAVRSLMDETSHFVVDRERRVLIVTGTVPTLQTVAEFLRGLEEAQKVRASKNKRIRIVWLVTGLRETPRPPKDMKPVIDELAAHGIEDLRLVSQSIIDVTSGPSFKSQGVAPLEESWNLSIQGQIADLNEEAGWKLGLSLDVNTPSGAKLCMLDTQLQTPPGHFVVLGVTPTGGTTSVFVVQMLLSGK